MYISSTIKKESMINTVHPLKEQTPDTPNRKKQPWIQEGGEAEVDKGRDGWRARLVRRGYQGVVGSSESLDRASKGGASTGSQAELAEQKTKVGQQNRKTPRHSRWSRTPPGWSS